MSWHLLREARADATLGRRQMGRKMVLMFLAARAEDDGLVKVGARIISAETGLDHRHVRRVLTDLEDMGRIDLVHEGRSGRGRAHTWRVLTAAEWRSRAASYVAEKGGSRPPFTPPGKGGLETPEKGVPNPHLEQDHNHPSIPSIVTDGESTPQGGGPAADPSLPGLGVGEEGLAALGVQRQRPREVADAMAELDARRAAGGSP